MSDATTNQDPIDHVIKNSPGDGLNQSPKSHGRNRQLLIVSIVAIAALLIVLAAFLLLRRGSDPPATKAEATEESATPNEVKLSAESLKAAGIEMEGVTQRPAVATLKVTGTVETNPQQTQSVTTLVSGRVQRVAVVIGDRVRAGSVIAVVSSPEVAEMHGKLREAETRLQLAERNLARLQRAENRVGVLQARAKLDEAEATLKRTKRLIELGVGAGKDLIAAEANYNTAKAEYDFQSNISLNRDVQQAQAEAETARVDAGHIRQSLVVLDAHLNEGQRDQPNENISLVSIRAPVSGIVTERLVNAGAGVQPGTPLFTIANISTLWVIANVPEGQVGSLHVGTPAELRSSTLGDDAIAGLLREQCWGAPPAAMAFCGHRAGEPVPAGTGLIDQNELRALGVQPPDELLDVTLARPDMPEGDDLGTVIFGGIGNGDSIFVDIKTDVECARLCHG